MKRIEEKKEEVTTQPEQSLYPPADTKPAEGQIWEEKTAYQKNIWLLLKKNNIRLIGGMLGFCTAQTARKAGGESSPKWRDVGFEMEFSWDCFRLHEEMWKCLSLATDRFKVGQVWINRSQENWTVVKVLEDGRANIKNQYGEELHYHQFMAPNEYWHLIKDVQEEKKESLPERDFSVPAVGDIYEWTGNNYPGIPPRKRYTVSVVSEKKSIVELDNLMGTYDFSPGLETKWKLVYKYGSPVKVGKDYVFEKSSGEWLQSHARMWSRGNEAIYVFHSEKGRRVEVAESGFQQSVFSGDWTIYSEEEAKLYNSIGSCYPGIEIDLSKIDDLEEIVSKPKKQEKKKMNLIDVMDIKDIQIKKVDEEVIKDKQCELAELFGYEASENKKGEVIFRREGKLSGGIVITPEKLVQLFEKQIKEEANCGNDTTLEAALNYGIVESVELVLPGEGADEE
jgi:hypothetical protein